jgi:hypothetical protein
MEIWQSYSTGFRQESQGQGKDLLIGTAEVEGLLNHEMMHKCINHLRTSGEYIREGVTNFSYRLISDMT